MEDESLLIIGLGIGFFTLGACFGDTSILRKMHLESKDRFYWVVVGAAFLIGATLGAFILGSKFSFSELTTFIVALGTPVVLWLGIKTINRNQHFQEVQRTHAQLMKKPVSTDFMADCDHVVRLTLSNKLHEDPSNSALLTLLYVNCTPELRGRLFQLINYYDELYQGAELGLYNMDLVSEIQWMDALQVYHAIWPMVELQKLSVNDDVRWKVLGLPAVPLGHFLERWVVSMTGGFDVRKLPLGSPATEELETFVRDAMNRKHRKSTA